jgi:hypothetical protein
MPSCTNTTDSNILAIGCPLMRYQAIKPSSLPTDMDTNKIEEELEDIEDMSRLALCAVDSIVLEKRRRMRTGFHNTIPDYRSSINEEMEEDEEDVEIEGLGNLALRARDSVYLLRQDSERNGTASAKRRMSRKDKVRGWFLRIWLLHVESHLQ